VNDSSSSPGFGATQVPNIARIYDALLGGKDNYAVDRAAARRLVAAIPEAAYAARENRAFLSRAVRFLAADAGISQFLDIGTGLPVRGHVHEVAQAVNPAAKIVYVDNDPVVVAHARALLVKSSSVIAVEGDARSPRNLLTMPDLREVIDFDKPVAVLLVAVLHFVPDDDDPFTAVETIMENLPAGSYLAISHVTGDEIPDSAVKRAAEIYDQALASGVARSRAEIARLFGGLEMVPPGLVDVGEWRSRHSIKTLNRRPLFWAGVGRKLKGEVAQK
jgi:hypothetical protein